MIIFSGTLVFCIPIGIFVHYLRRTGSDCCRSPPQRQQEQQQRQQQQQQQRPVHLEQPMYVINHETYPSDPPPAYEEAQLSCEEPPPAYENVVKQTS